MIYLDLDGPMVDWTGGVFKLFGEKLTRERFATVDNAAADALGVKKSDVWAMIAKKGEQFWSDLKPHPWSKDFYAELSRIDEVVVLTSPSHIPSAASGKTIWIKSFFGGNFRQYILTSRKDLLAKTGDILIDDYDKNIEAFTQAGGIGILFPRPWNKEAANSHRAVAAVLEKLSQVFPRYTPPHLRERTEEKLEFSAHSKG